MWRVGRKLGRTIYQQVGNNPSDDDLFIGITDSKADAAMIVWLANNHFRRIESDEEPKRSTQ